MCPRWRTRAVWVAAALASGAGCRGSLEGVTRADLDRVQRQFEVQRPEALPELDGGQEAYAAYALRQSPDLRAALAEWRASVFGISEARRLPDPMISWELGLFFTDSPHITFEASQTIPWPMRLSAAADAASAEARSAQRRFEAAALELRERVARAYWALWLARRSQDVQREQHQLLEDLAATARNRLEVGMASLADVAQIDLALARVDDELAGLAEQEAIARAALLSVLAAPAELDTPTMAPPPAAVLPALSTDELVEAALAHPNLDAAALAVEAAQARLREANNQWFPSLMVGAGFEDDQYGEMGMLILGASVPIWWGTYLAAQDAAEARVEARDAQREALRHQVVAATRESIAMLRDATRRARLYVSTLLPQALATYGSVRGAYEAGNASAIAALLARRDVIELQLGLLRAQAEAAAQWARLESITARRLDPQSQTEVSP